MSSSRVISILPRGLRDRRWWTVPLVWLIALGLLLAVVAAAQGLGGTLELDRLPGVGPLDYGRDSFGSVAPLDHAFVVDSLGTPFFDRLREEVGAELTPPSAGNQASRDRPRGTSDDPEDPRSPGEIPASEEVAAGPDLRVRMDVDRARASRGDTLEYTITVTNVGEGTAKRVRVLSHIPEHTSLVATPQCGGRIVRVSPGDGPGGLPATCIDLPVGATAPGDHEITIGMKGMNAGRTERFVFRVAVDADAPQGHAIRNHAHVASEQGPDRKSNEVKTVVR